MGAAASKTDCIAAIEHWTKTRRVAEALTREPEKTRFLFEEWNADPVIRQQQIDLAIGRRKPQKKRKRVFKALPPARHAGKRNSPARYRAALFARPTALSLASIPANARSRSPIPTSNSIGRRFSAG
jgi:hypothetical protein